MKALVIMLVRNVWPVSGLIASLEPPAWEMQAPRTRMTEQGRLPSRRTWERRLATLPNSLPARIGCLGRHLVGLIDPWVAGGQAVAIDSTVLHARGGVWHQQHRDAGVVPRTAIDTEAGWTKSGWHGWGYGWKLHLATTVAAVWISLAARFTDRFVRDAMRSIFDVPDFPALLGLMPLVWMHAHDAGYPIGGSLAFAQAIEQRYRELGGQISYGTRVDRILVEGSRAVGVRLADGTEHRADDVVSAADGHATVFGLLEDGYASPAIHRAYQTQRSASH